MARLLGKSLQTRAEISPSRVMKKPELMVGVQVDTTGLNADRWRYWTMSDLVESTWKLLENVEGGGMGVTRG